jgi:methylmalonyl-CoA/ethylmalonyl-CoA epimerase
MNAKLHHFGISVPDRQATVRWYEEKLGFRPVYTYQLPDLKATVTFLKLGDFRLEIFELQNAQSMPERSKDLGTDLPVHGLKHVTFSVTDLEETLNSLTARGVVFVTPVTEVPESGGERFAFFKDNNGILIELYQQSRYPEENPADG